MKTIVLSTPRIPALMPDDGIYEIKTITEQEAKEWVRIHNPENHSAWATVKLLGMKPLKVSDVPDTCKSYDEALCISVTNRRVIQFGKDYPAEQLRQLGIVYRLIKKIYRLKI